MNTPIPTRLRGLPALFLAAGLLVAGGSHVHALSAKANIYQETGEKLVFTSNQSAFEGYLMLGAFSGTPNFAADSASTLFAAFRPWLPDLTVLQTGVADFDGSVSGTSIWRRRSPISGS